MTKIYKSKIGLEIVLILAVAFGSIAISMVISGDYKPLVLNVFILAGIFYIFMKTEYTISNNKLNVKCSVFINNDIEIKSIRRIKETYNPISAPAASIDRLELLYNESDTVLISPKDKRGFIADLLKINPNIEVQMREK